MDDGEVDEREFDGSGRAWMDQLTDGCFDRPYPGDGCLDRWVDVWLDGHEDDGRDGSGLGWTS